MRRGLTLVSAALVVAAACTGDGAAPLQPDRTAAVTTTTSIVAPTSSTPVALVDQRPEDPMLVTTSIGGYMSAPGTVVMLWPDGPRLRDRRAGNHRRSAHLRAARAGRPARRGCGGPRRRIRSRCGGCRERSRSSRIRSGPTMSWPARRPHDNRSRSRFDGSVCGDGLVCA